MSSLRGCASAGLIDTHTSKASMIRKIVQMLMGLTTTTICYIRTRKEKLERDQGEDGEKT